MGKPTGFLDYARQDAPKRPVTERIRDYCEVEGALPAEELTAQAARCMDCGVPFCHLAGCPLHSLVPEWSDMVFRNRWRAALELLLLSNPFPELTGRLCPALCEAACTLSIDEDPVAVRQLELQIAERGWREGWMRPQPAPTRTGRRVGVVGSGPAGLAAAQRLARRGHEVVVFERRKAVGGMLRYGVPDFKLAKPVLDRRLEQMQAEGVLFETGVWVGADISPRYLQRTFDAVLLATGCWVPRDLKVPGRDLAGIHFAMDFLSQQNRLNAGETVPAAERICAEGRHVVVIGGGDTGADCVGTARRQGAAGIAQVEILPRPPERRGDDCPWPTWPNILRTSTSHEEGCERLWSVLTREFTGHEGRVSALRCVRVESSSDPGSGQAISKEVPGSAFELKADLVLLAAGFLHTDHGPLADALELTFDRRGNVAVDENLRADTAGTFAAGDCVTGPSLVVRAIRMGLDAAAAIDADLSA